MTPLSSPLWIPKYGCHCLFTSSPPSCCFFSSVFNLFTVISLCFRKVVRLPVNMCNQTAIVTQARVIMSSCSDVLTCPLSCLPTLFYIQFFLLWKWKFLFYLLLWNNWYIYLKALSTFFFFNLGACSIHSPNSPTWNWTWVPCSGSVESKPLDYQGSPKPCLIIL